jgi:myo-inositol-1(or 4)-monophosphatase
MAAGCLLILEAGGLVADLDGKEDYLDKGHIVCGSPKIFGQLLPLLAAEHKRRA